MRNILIVDTNFGFLSDVEARLLLNEIEDVDITVRNKIDGIHEEIEYLQPDEIIVFVNLLNSLPSWDFGVSIKTYARDAAGIKLSDEKGYPCYGIVKNAGDLITAIENNKIVTVEKTQPASITPQVSTPVPSSIPEQPTVPQKTEAYIEQPTVQKPYESQDILQATQPEIPSQIPAQEPVNPRFQNTYQQPAPQTPQQPPIQPVAPQDMNSYFTENREAILAALLSGQNTPQQTPPQQPMYPPNTWGNPAYPQPQTPFGQPTISTGYPGQYPISANPQGMPGVFNPGYEVERDMGNIKKKAKVISTYSAKGGVGKTTLSCELATFLALTSNGRSKYKVCIADFNIDFGNVLNTLDFDPKGACMTHWAASIKERMYRGEKPENINYTQTEIEAFLQQKDRDGLYALLAPLTNADSMGIKPVEVEIMLRNLIHNAGFDYIVCDTGNNTRDATFLALNCSDDVFLILTQSVNAANSNQSFLMTMLPINFDMNKIKTVINMVKPGRAVGATVDEVAESIVNPVTRQPFECIAKINDLNDVRNAENIGEPLVYNSTHEFTQNIATIAKYVVGENFVLPELPKQNLFSELLNKLQKFKR